MKQRLGIFTNSSVNKYGYRFSVESIENAFSETWKTGRPMFISHDYHRPIGWTKPLGLYIDPLEVRLYGIASFFETKEEKDNIKQDIDNFLEQINKIDVNEKTRLEKSLKGLLSGNEVFMNRECTCVIDKEIVSKVLNYKIDEKDKRALIPINDLEVIAPGVFEIDGYTVFAHRYFRRSLSELNNLNDIFLKKLLSLKNNPKVEVKIAIDPHTIGLKDTYREPSELEYWWGPKFNDSLLDIPEGVSHYKANNEQKEFHGISGTQFWWHKQNNIQSLECEEIRDMPSLGIGEDKYACRYVHSMIDNNTGLSYHLDGAMRIYDENSFLERIDTDISKAGKNTEYVKLWRVDGEIDIVLWKELLNDFYRDNRLVGEYLLGDKLENIQKENTQQNLYKVKLTDYMPKDHGYNIFISYYKRGEFLNRNEVEVLSDNIEYTALDLLKLIIRDIRTPIFIDENTNYIAYEDLDINFPIIIFRGKNAINLANKTMQHLYTLCEHFYVNKDDRIITISIGIEYEDKIAIFSFVSHIEAMYTSYKKNPIEFPDSNDIGKWCDMQHKFLANNYVVEKISDSYLDKNGLFFINRFDISNLIEIEDNKTYYLRTKNKELAEAASNGLIKIYPASIIKKSTCLKCKKEYIKCDCSVFLDENCTVKLENFELYGFFISTRTAFQD